MSGEAATRLLASLYPWQVTATEALERAVAFLDWDHDPERIVRAGYGAGGLIAAVGAGATAATSTYRIAATLCTVTCTLLVVHAIHTYPRVKARAIRTRSLGAAPNLVARIVMRMRLSPSPERAAAFAARTGHGRLAASLRRHHRRTRHTEQSGLATLEDTWGEWFPSLGRALELVRAAQSVPKDRREGVLDRALTTVLEGTSERMQSFAATARGPVTALYAFGVLLPTAVVALVPAAATAGLGVSLWTVSVLYGVVIPGGIAAVSVRLVARRPVAFPPPALDSVRGSVTDRPYASLLAGGLSAGVAWRGGTAVGTAPMGAVAAAGVGCGVALTVWLRPVVQAHDRIEAAERALPEALSLIGRQVAEGVPVERAVRDVAAALDGPLGELLGDAIRRQRQLGDPTSETLLDTRQLPSVRIAGGLRAVVLAATEGPPAGDAVLSLADHMDELETIEREARHQLAYVCRTLHSTGAVFAPLVAGTTVALSEEVETGALASAELAGLEAVVGWYVLALAVILPTLATGLTRGLDRGLVGYRVGRSLTAATTVFLCSYLLGGAIV